MRRPSGDSLLFLLFLSLLSFLRLQLLGEVDSMEQAFQERDEQIAGAERRYQELMQEVQESKKRSKEQWSRMESEFGKVSGESQSQRQVLESVQQHLRTLHQGLEVIRHEELQENNHVSKTVSTGEGSILGARVVDVPVQGGRLLCCFPHSALHPSAQVRDRAHA